MNPKPSIYINADDDDDDALRTAKSKAADVQAGLLSLL